MKSKKQSKVKKVSIFKDMQLYIGTKLIKAIPMTRQEYNDFREWLLPADKNGKDKGFLVEYVDGGKANTAALKGYVSWSPIDVFSKAYKPSGTLSFGAAIYLMKKGMKLARTGWNGKGMWCIYVPGTKNCKLAPDTPYAKALPKRKTVDILPHFDMYTINAKGRKAMLPGWLASQSDMDTEDWGIVK